MDVAAVDRPVFTKPINANLARVDLRLRPDGRSEERTVRTASPAVLQRVEGSFTDAVRAAMLASRADSGNRAIAILQAVDGSYHLTGMTSRGVLPSGAKATFVTRIDGNLRNVTGRRPPTIAAAHVTRLHPDLRAVVGAYSWVDLRTAGEGDRQRLPKLSG